MIIKKIFKQLGLFLLVILIGNFVAGQEIEPKNGLMGFYQFNGNTKDSSGLQKKGKIENAKLTDDRNGKAGGAWKFNSKTTSYIDLPIDISVDKYPVLTIVAWIQANVSSSYKPVITGGNYKRDRALFIVSKDNAWRWAVQCGKDGELIGPPVITDNWTFFAIMYDQKNQEVRFIVNDQLFSSRAKTGPGAQNVIIGQFDGVIDEIQFFNRFLTLSELERLYGKKINAKEDQLKVTERYGYKEKLRRQEEASIQLNDKYIIAIKDFVVTDAINGSNHKAALTDGDTVIITAIDNEKGWVRLNFKDNQSGWVNKGYLEENAYKEGSSKIIHRIKNTFSNIFQFTSLKSWIIVIIFAVILYLSYIFFEQINNSLRWLRRKIVGSKYGATTLEKTFLGRIFPPENIKPWSLFIGVATGAMIFICSIWDGEEMEWFLNEGFNLLPVGYDRTIHWFLYIFCMLIILSTIAMIIESFVVAGWGVGWLRILILLTLNLMSLIVTFYIFVLIMLILLVMLGLTIFSAVGNSGNYICPHCRRSFSAQMGSSSTCPHCNGMVTT